LIAEEDVVITITHQGYIKRQALGEYSSQRRGGRGKTGVKSTEKDFVEQLFITTTHQNLLIFTNAGIMYTIPVFKIPVTGKRSRGVLIQNITAIKRDEQITATMPIKEFEEDQYLLTCTKNGYVKRTECTEYNSMRMGGLIALNLEEDDELISVKITDGNNDVIVATKNGKAIRFSEDQVRPMGRATRGVNAIKLDDDDFVKDMEIAIPGSTVLSITEKGYGKRTEMEEFRSQNRYGKGVIMMKTTKETGNLIGFMIIDDGNDVMMVTEKGIIIRICVDEIPKYGRNTRGVKIQNLEPGDTIRGIAKITFDD